MLDPTGTLLSLGQILILAFTAIGWGLWVESLAGGKLRPRLADHALCAMAGWAACTLLLQNLVYLGLRVAWSAWLGLVIALAGWIVLLWRQPRENRRAWLGGLAGPGAVALAVILFQGAGLWTHGAHNYYGAAHNDQVNYVQLAQFLVEKPFDSNLSDVGLEPWMIKAIDIKDMRIGQSVANAYLAVISGSDAKVAYGAVSVFGLGLMAAAVFALLRNLGLSTLGAMLAALWAGALPIVTQMHLDGFFSQAFVLGALPALITTTLMAQRHPRLTWLSGGLILAQVLNGYTEIFVVGVALLAAGLLTRFEIGLGRRLALLGGIVLIALLAVPAFLLRCVAFVGHQYRVATTPDVLADLVPRSGTWGGWSELFFPSGVSMVQPVPQFMMLAGFFVLGMILAGVFSSQPTRRLWLSLIAAVPAGLCMAVLSLPAFPKYPFAKLLATFSPLFVVFASLGLWRSLPLLAALARQHPISTAPPRWTRGAGYFLAGILIVASGRGSAHLLGEIIRNEGILTLVNSAQTRALYRQLEANPGRIYLLNEQHNILNAWLAYHARHSRIYADVEFIGDRPTPSTLFIFRRPPPRLDLSLLNRNGIRAISLTSSIPDILVRNPQGIEGDQNLTFYWIADSAFVEFLHLGKQPEDFVFTLRGLSGPANPDSHRVVSLVAQTIASEPLVRAFDGDAKLVFPVHLRPGRNVFIFNVIEPTEWLVHLPGDARKLMVRIQELNLTPANKPPGL